MGTRVLRPLQEKREFLENLFSFGAGYGEKDPTAINALLGQLGEGKAKMSGVELAVPAEMPPLHFSGRTVAHRRLVQAGAEWLAARGYDWSATDLAYEAGRADVLARGARIAVECGYTSAGKVLVALEQGWKVLVVPYPATTGLSRQGFLFEPPVTPERVVEELQGMVKRLRRLGQEDRSQAPDTMKAYAFYWGRFKQWCEDKGLEVLPAEAQTVALFLADQALQSKGHPSARTARTTVYAIRWFHLQAGHPSPTDRVEVEEVMAGIRRLDGYVPKLKEVMTAEERQRALESIENPTVKLMLLARASSQEVAQLQKEDLRQGEDGRWAVSIQSRGKRRQVEVPEALARELIGMRRRAGVTTLVASRSGQAMTRAGVFKQVRKAFVEVGLSPVKPSALREEGLGGEL